MNRKNKNIQLDDSNDGLVVERNFSKGNKKSTVRERKQSRMVSLEFTKKARGLSRRFGYTQFFVNGKNGARVLGALSKVCRVKNVAFLSDGVTFEAPSKHSGQIIAILNNLCYDYKIIKVKGAMPLAVNAAARLGFAVGLALMIAAVAVFPMFVTRVSVYAADGQAIDGALNAGIADILSSYGVSEGRWLPKLNCADVEKSLLALNGVSYASVLRRGTHINVSIKREQPDDKFVEVFGSEVKATRTAVVTRVIVEGGTAVVDYGDVVQAGDTLIDGFTMFGDEKLNVEAKGTVYGKVYYRRTKFFADSYVERTTGRVKTVTKLSMFGKQPKTPVSPFESYELETGVENLGFLLPFRIYTYTFREIAEVERENTLSEEEMGDRVYSEIVAEFGEPIRVLDRYQSSFEANGGRYVTVTVEAEVKIS